MQRMIRNIRKLSPIFLVALAFVWNGCSNGQQAAVDLSKVGVIQTKEGAEEQVETFFQRDTIVDEFTQDGSGAKARVLLVVDNSISMGQELFKFTWAAENYFDFVNLYLPGVDLKVGVITSNTFGSGIAFAGDPVKHNPNATQHEINRENWCGPVGVSGGFDFRYCNENWWINGTKGFTPVEDSVSGFLPYVTGDEPDPNLSLVLLMFRGFAGHWLESSAWALMQFFNNANADLALKDPDAFLQIIVGTDTNESSHITDQNCIDNLCHGLLDSRNKTPDPNDFENYAFYEDLNNQFLTALLGFRDPSTFSLNLVGGFQSMPGCNIERVEERLVAAIGELNSTHGTNGLIRDICLMEDFEDYIAQLAQDIVPQLNKVFQLSHAPVSEILESSIVVKVNGVIKDPSTYSYDAATGEVTFNTAPGIGDQIEIEYFAPQVAFQLAGQPEPETIQVFFGQNLVLVPESDWNYDPVTNSIVFVSGALAGAPGELITVKYFNASDVDDDGSGGNGGGTSTVVGGSTNPNPAINFEGGGGCGAVSSPASSDGVLMLWLMMIAMMISYRRFRF